MNIAFFQQVESILATERLDAYRQDGAGLAATLARYLWNMSLCEALYSPLQIAEIALRNAVHGWLSGHFQTERWYDAATALPVWQQQQIQGAREKLQNDRKAVTPGRMVAELHFGFWTGFFNKSHARSGLGHALAGQVFAHAPRPERDMKKLDARWHIIRTLRNRVFHHERIIHWKDLETKHEEILRVIGWISPELLELTRALDRFTAIRRQGLDPWINRIRHHWPDPAATPATAAAKTSVVAVLPYSIDATNGAATPFGHRWGGDVIPLATEHLAALQSGQTLALDVQNEYIVFLKFAESAKLKKAIQTNSKGPCHGV